MDKSNKKSHISNPTLLRSVSNETKDRFDNLLKNALQQHDNKLNKDTTNRKRSKSKQLDKQQNVTVNDDIELQSPTKIQWHHKQSNTLEPNEHQSTGNFILEKFLSDAVNLKANESPIKNNKDFVGNLHSSITFIKPPVPLPRQSKTDSSQKFTNDSSSSSSTSNKTYNITSPKVKNPNLLKDIERLSTSSKVTYNVEQQDSKTIKSTKNKDDIEVQSNSSGATYNVDADKSKQKLHKTYNSKVSSAKSTPSNSVNVPVGDILIHNSPSSKNFVKVVRKNQRKESSSTEEVSRNSSVTVKQSIEQSETSDDVVCEKISAKRETKQAKTDSATVNKKKIADNSNEKIELHDLGSTKSRKTKIKKRLSNESSTDETSNIKNQTEISAQKVYTYEDVIGIAIYKTDKLLLNSLINHPCVKIHIVDSVTGKYLEKSIESNSESANSLSVSKYLSPLITRAFNLQAKRSLIPQWEELIKFDEDFTYMLEYKNPVIIFFELLDFLSFTAASLNYRREGSNSGWHKVAWAFLKPIGKNGHLNTEQKIRLQLYKPKKYSVKKTIHECILYDWWSGGNLVKYPSTLYVNVKKVKADTVDRLESKDALHADNLEKLKIVSDDAEGLDLEETNKDENIIAPSEKVTCKRNIIRLVSQSCKVPNKIEERFNSGKKGCLFIKFSNDGTLLACGTAGEERHSILLYSVSRKKDYCKFSGHQALIYDLHWSKDDSFLISASADCTVYVWDVVKRSYHPKQILPHPSFVYCAQLNTTNFEIATGCYDQVVRIWKYHGAIDSEYELVQELDGHGGYITSLCYGKDENLFYSSDSVGVIIEWSFADSEWCLQRTLKFRELQNTVINAIVLHPTSNKLLVCCRDSIHRMIDITVGCIVQWFRGALNYRVQMNGCIAPCGGLVFAPSEDGTVCIWNADTGLLQATYVPYSTSSKEPSIPHCVQYHPLDHVLAISHHGSHLPILLCSFDKSSTGLELKLKECADIKEDVTEKQKDLKKIVNTKINKLRNENRSVKNVKLDVIIEKIDDVLITANKE